VNKVMKAMGSIKDRVSQLSEGMLVSQKDHSVYSY
jgi:hypothetical protein